MDEADYKIRLSHAKRLQTLREAKLRRSRIMLADCNAALASAQRSQDASQLRLEDNISYREQMLRSAYNSMKGQSLSTCAVLAGLNEFDRADFVVAENEVELMRLSSIRAAQETVRDKQSLECNKHSKNLAKVDYLIEKTSTALEALRELNEEQQLDELSNVKPVGFEP